MRKNLAITLLVIPLVLGCSSNAPESSTATQPAATPAPANSKETATVPADSSPYRGLKCGDVKLGISWAAFRKLAQEKHWSLSEEATKYPAILKKFRVPEIPPPVASISWNPSVKFVDDGEAFRLYEIEGQLSEHDSSAPRKLSSKLGKSHTVGLAHQWTKAGTKVRLIDDETNPLLSFTHDELIDLSSTKIADAIDRGDYVH